MTEFDGDAIRAAWVLLEVPTESELEVLPLDSYFDSGLCLAVDRVGGRHLLVSTDQRRRPWTVSDSSLRDAIRDLEFGGRTGRYLDVSCIDMTLFDVFDELLLDVLNATRASEAPASAVDESLARWRLLFRSSRLSVLARNRRFGVFAELFVLRAAAELIGPEALNFWVGPESKSHDFEFPGGCLEVKAVGELSSAVRIHGLGQLESHDSRPLSLAVLVLRESASGHTVSQLLRDLNGFVDSESLDAKLALLGLEGWQDSAEPLGAAEVYVASIDQAFPRLTGASIAGEPALAVSDVEYDVALPTVKARSEARTIESEIARLMEAT